MPDESPHQPPPIPTAEAIPYYTPDKSAAIHPALLTLSCIAGFLVGAAVLTLAGIFGGALFFENSSDKAHQTEMAFAAIAFAGLLVSIIFLVRIFRRRKSKTIDRRWTGGLIFLAGFLLGAGLACLLDGICFTAMSRS